MMSGDPVPCKLPFGILTKNDNLKAVLVFFVLWECFSYPPRWIASTDFVDVHQSAVRANKSWPGNTAFVLWWQTAEDCVLAHMASYAATTKSHLSLHFDGLMVVRAVGVPCPPESFWRDMEEYRLLQWIRYFSMSY